MPPIVPAEDAGVIPSRKRKGDEEAEAEDNARRKRRAMASDLFGIKPEDQTAYV